MEFFYSLKLVHMKDSNCIFCKIISKELPAVIVYEDAEYLAFLDLHPANPGHTLVIPKEHYPNFLATPDDLACGTFKVVKRIAPAVLAAVGATDFNIGVNNGPVAGQIIMHTHAHFIPRLAHDGHQMWRSTDYAEGEMQAVGERIRKNMG